MAATIRGRVLHGRKTARHAPGRQNPTNDTGGSDLADFATSVGGWREAAKRLGVNVGTLHHIAAGRRAPTRAFLDRWHCAGYRPGWFVAGALAILAWAEQPAPRAPWPRPPRKERNKHV